MPVNFSFIIPTRNEAAYIADCLRSIRAQTRKDYEIIVVDTLSSDGTAAMAKRYADRVIAEPKRGPATARNTGAAAARGELLVFADADVRFEPDFLEKLERAFERRIVVGGVFHLHAHDARRALYAKSYGAVNLIVWFLNAIGVAITAGSCFAFRRTAFERAGGFNPCLWTNEDHDLAHRVGKLGRFAYFREIPVWTSVRRVAKLGFCSSIMTYIRSTAVYALNKSCIRDYW